MPALEIRQLHKTYGNGHVALQGIDLTVEEGDFFALLGPNGAGKSTCIGIVSTLVRKSSGEVSIFGDDIEKDPIAAKSHLGVVPQEFNFNIFEPVEEIIANQGGYQGVAPRLVRERTRQLLRELDLWDKRRVQARELSGGMKRRLMIARALIHQPRLLILDEPTAGVDIELRRSMWGYMRRINEQGTTIILTTHYLEEAEQMCRNVAIIDRGHIVKHDRMKNLLRQLDCETFVLNARETVEELPDRIGAFALRRIDEHTIEADLPKPHSLNELMRELDRLGIAIDSLRNKANRLEELFLRLTGKPPAAEETP